MRERSYQTKCGNAALACVLRGVSSVLCAPTGSGKTHIAGDAIGRLIESNFNIGFTVHRKELLKQASQEMTRRGLDHGLIMPGHEPTSHRLHIASINTILARGAALDRWKASLNVCIPDEVHHTPAEGYSRFVASLPADCPLLGLSATPWGAGGGPLGGPFREVIRTPGVAALTNDGYLSAVRVFAPPFGNVDQLKKIGKVGEDYNRKRLAKFLNQPEFNKPAVPYYAKYMAGQPCIVWCCGVQHAHDVAELFRQAGWRAKAVWGDMDDGERDRILHPESGELATGVTQVVCFSDLLGEGVNIPAVSGVIMLRPTYSLRLYLQVLGRIERPVYARGADQDTREGRLSGMAASWKPWATLVDLRDNVKAHGMPDDEVPWTLADGIRGIYRNLRPTTRCERCFCIFDRGDRRCPACGSGNPLTAQNAKLFHPALLRGYDANQVRGMSLDEAMSIAVTQQDFNFIAASRRLPNGWAKAEFYAKCYREEQVALRRAGLA